MERTKRTVKSMKRDGTIERGRIRAELEAIKLRKEGHDNTWHVLPGKQEGWEVKKGGRSNLIWHFDTKQQAVAFARQVAQNQGGELIIHKKDGTVQRIEKLAVASGVDPQHILRFVNHADLMRIKGIDGEMAELLEASGVDTVAALARCNAEIVQKKMEEVNAAKKLVRRVPTAAQVQTWIDQAKDLPRIIQY